MYRLDKVLKPNILQWDACYSPACGEWGAPSTGHTAEVSTPHILTAFAGKEINRVAAGGVYEDDENGGFSLVVSSAGNLYSFGSNTHGQLGASPEQTVTTCPPLTLGSECIHTYVAVDFKNIVKERCKRHLLSECSLLWKERSLVFCHGSDRRIPRQHGWFGHRRCGRSNRP